MAAELGGHAMKIQHEALQGYSGQILAARIAAFALHAKGINFREVANAIGDSIKFDRSVPMLAAFKYGEDRYAAFNLVEDDEFAFAMVTNGQVWKIQRTTRSLAFFTLTLRGENVTVAAEIGEPMGNAREASLKRVALISQVGRLNDFTDLHWNVHLRAVTVKGTGRVGIILPKDLGWRVLPIPELSFGASARISELDDWSDPIPLDAFIGKIESTGGSPGG